MMMYLRSWSAVFALLCAAFAIVDFSQLANCSPVNVTELEVKYGDRFDAAMLEKNPGEPDDLDPTEPVELDRPEIASIDMSEYANDPSNAGDDDPNAPPDPGHAEDEQYNGPTIAGLLDPKVTKVGSQYVWQYTNLNLKSLQPMNVKRDNWGGVKPNVNRQWVRDPANAKQTALQVFYPKGTSTPTSKWNPRGKKGGTGFFIAPISPVILSRAKYVTFQYDVFFPANFDYVKGGKLPGLWGGTGTRYGCSGGNDGADCFSLRFMFRGGGDGEEYLYLPKAARQDPGLCKIKPFSYCDPDYGYSIGRGAFKFNKGGWTTVKQLVAVNTPGRQNGVLKVWANNKLVLSFNKIVWRTSPRVTVQGVAFETFFGGSTAAHVAHKDEHTMFRNFKLVAAY